MSIFAKIAITRENARGVMAEVVNNLEHPEIELIFSGLPRDVENFLRALSNEAKVCADDVREEYTDPRKEQHAEIP